MRQSPEKTIVVSRGALVMVALYSALILLVVIGELMRRDDIGWGGPDDPIAFRVVEPQPKTDLGPATTSPKATTRKPREPKKAA